MLEAELDVKKLEVKIRRQRQKVAAEFRSLTPEQRRELVVESPYVSSPSSPGYLLPALLVYIGLLSRQHILANISRNISLTCEKCVLILLRQRYDMIVFRVLNAMFIVWIRVLFFFVNSITF